MNTHTPEQLLMCEKEDLGKYIEELKEHLECSFDGYPVSNWFNEKLDIHIKYQLSNEGGEYYECVKHLGASIPTCLDDIMYDDNMGYYALTKEIEKLKSDMSCMLDKERLSFRLGYGSLTEDFDWDKAVLEMRKEIDELKEDISVLNDDKEELFNAWLHYWSAGEQGSEHSCPLSEWDGGKFERIRLGENSDEE